jgi:hypothetical protein
MTDLGLHEQATMKSKRDSWRLLDPRFRIYNLHFLEALFVSLIGEVF